MMIIMIHFANIKVRSLSHNKFSDRNCTVKNNQLSIYIHRRTSIEMFLDLLLRRHSDWPSRPAGPGLTQRPGDKSDKISDRLNSLTFLICGQLQCDQTLSTLGRGAKGKALVFDLSSSHGSRAGSRCDREAQVLGRGVECGGGGG